MATTNAVAADTPRASARVQVQKFGTFLSNMVMPNIGAFIAWGLITALVIEKGWLNGGGNAGLPADGLVAQIGGWGDFAGGGIVGPMITYLLPILIGYTGGKAMYDVRGGVVGAIATMGVIAGSDIPMFMGAMIMGPLGGWTMKKLDALWDGKIKPGFEMLVNNFSAGIWGGILAAVGFFLISRFVTWISALLGGGVQFLVANGLLPLTSIIIEPAKILFLNNAINHGVLTPLGTQQSLETGKSVLFLLEANPAVGLGILLAFTIFGKGAARASAPGAAIIHFFGGIHEIYFPYILAKPKLIIAAIAGGATQIFINVLFGSGLISPAAPGSIIAVYLAAARDSYLGITLSWLAGATVTFLIAAVLLKADRSADVDLAAATASMEQMKGKKSSVTGALTGAAGSVATAAAAGPIHKIVFACDAGMGSSAMGASVLRRKVQAAGYDDVTVVNKAISSLDDSFDLVVTHQDLTARAQEKTPSATHVSVDNFMNSPRYDEIVELLGTTNSEVDAAPAADVAPVAAAAPAADAAVDEVEAAEPTQAAEPSADDASELLPVEAIKLDGTATNMTDAINEAGGLLLAQGAVEQAYIDSMHVRETSVSTAMGNGLAIPHGTNEAKAAVLRTALAFVRYDQPIDWNGEPTRFVVAIAGVGDDHLQILAQLATVFLDDDQVARLEAATTPQEVQQVLASAE